MNFVVGSGPAGVSAAQALLSKGRPVTMLDVGKTLEKENSALLSSLRSIPYSKWPAETIRRLKGKIASSRKGIPLKKVYGSEFAYRALDEVDEVPSGVLLKASHARGGLSNVWGAVLLPFTSSDIDSWPISLKDLEPHYREAMKLMNISGQKDDLEKLFPIYSEKISPLRMSRQAAVFEAHLLAYQRELNTLGVHFGRARLAVRENSSDEGPGCVYCGLCLTGCPYELIYNSSFTLKTLQKNSLFTYRPGVQVTRVAEEGNSVKIFVRNIENSKEEVFSGDRVFLAGGSVSTTMTLLSSLGLYDKEVELKTNQYFVLPFLQKKATANVITESLHTLCQMFVEIVSPGVSHRTVSLQMYSYNDQFRAVLTPFFRWLLGRMIVFQGYLHSDDSPSLKIKLINTSAGDKLKITPSRLSASDSPLKKVKNKLWELRKELGGWPLNMFLAPGKIGDGSHVGGTFPMSLTPGPLESDVWGRPCGLTRIHAVDSSVFPSIPSTTITLSVMANAHRIASLEGLS